MPKFCCLTCPQKDYSEKELDDKCPICGKEYQFPLKDYPESIKEYKIIKPIQSRGFYSVTYVAERGNLGNKFVLKVSSKKIYDYFGKDFNAECILHKKIADDSEHVVKIFDAFEEDVLFGGETVPCVISVLDFINGNPLEDYLKGEKSLSARIVAQIGIDLFRIVGDLESNQIRHNDLHSGNIMIQELRTGSHRAEALDPSIRAIVIDLGSVADGSLSDEMRIGDIHQVSRHLGRLSTLLIKNPEKSEDLEFRLASLLNERANMLGAPSNERLPTIEECIKDIKQTFDFVRSPWKELEVPKLSRLDDAYNAQTLRPWFVPLLLVDPDKQWQAAVSITGPQVVMGMRGCGKTMLLRSLQFHARATKENASEKLIQKLKDDGYVGLYVSCNKILETHKTGEISEPYARLLISFALEGLRAINHLKEIVKEMRSPEDVEVYSSYYRNIAEALSDSLADQEFQHIGSEYELERKLIQLQVLLSTGEKVFNLKGHPVDAFSRLSHALKRCTSLWSGHYILFLLDDVSTRYLDEKRIKQLFSQLLFQSDECAFKFTTEAQTFELVVQSPGEIEQAREGRDYRVFDLGAEVYDKVRSRGKQGKEFIEKILESRAKYYPNHPNSSPSQILGDINQKKIAEKIVSTPETSNQKKEIYWGISALAAVCVGDIGDVISIYEQILRKGQNKSIPVNPKIQSECYQSFCSRRLYDVNRKVGKLKDFALSFAEASHQLLMESYDRIKKGKTEERLRQYNKIYVRITVGDFQKQFTELRKLIDAGIFILAGGNDTPRAKTRHSNPIQQFVLTYRKLFGLSHFIPLGERDRFELSGDQLIEWLDHPENGKEILIRNLSTESDDSEYSETVDDREFSQEKDDNGENYHEEIKFNLDENKILQPSLLDNIDSEVIKNVFLKENFSQTSTHTKDAIPLRVPISRVLTEKQVSELSVNEIVVGLGFEDRSPASVTRLLRLVSPDSAHLLYYPDVKGWADEIRDIINKSVTKVSETSYNEVESTELELTGENILIDVTGLAKPFIFQSVRKALKLNKKVYICATKAENYYPQDEDIEKVFEADNSGDPFELIEKLNQILVSGEEGRYDCISQLQSDSDESRRRALCAFASAKHERLLTLLDEREYDQIEIVVPSDEGPKSRIAKLVAEVAASNYPNAGITEVDSHDLSSIMSYLVERYNDLYILKGYNFEVALSGSKLQAVACAALSVGYKLSQCWYVRPLSYDVGKFTTGTGDTKYYEISIPEI
ncbi:MAG: protein kinase family protein [Pyrinomonadaceae bacterium]|nr:protein kinase family protein [Pyrinomonadaceae bacterium]